VWLASDPSVERQRGGVALWVGKAVLPRSGLCDSWFVVVFEIGSLEPSCVEGEPGGGDAGSYESRHGECGRTLQGVARSMLALSRVGPQV
jgi:hypothetical protein